MSPVTRPSAVPAGLRHATAVPVTETEVQTPAAPPEVPQRPRKEQPTRFTLDLDRARHHFLKNYATEIEAKGASEVMRALLDELRDDPELAARVRARVWEQR